MNNAHISVEFLKPPNSTVDYYCKKPSKCIHCHTIMDPTKVFTGSIGSITKRFPQLYQCTKCKEYFVVTYLTSTEKDPTGQYFVASLREYDYGIEVDYSFAFEVEAVSPAFKDIYIQAMKAEAYNLDQIAGAGYRKSVEFLVRDYLIYLRENTPDDGSDLFKNDRETLSSKFLGSAIKLLPTERLRANATMSNWIGTDEVHYIKKYETEDINSMKRYIRTLAYEVSSELSTADAKAFIEAYLSKSPIK